MRKNPTPFLLAAAASALALPVAPASAQSYGDPSRNPYSLEPWDEDWSHLKDPAARVDPVDAIKYVPLGSGDAYASFGAQARYRYDYFNNFSFGPGVNDEDGFHLQRYLAHADLHLSENLRAFVQANSAFVDGRAGGGRYGDQDDFDLQQGFVDLKTSDASNPYAFLRLGRQELVYGAQRIISPDDWRNVRRTFDGAKLSFSVPDNTTDVFAVRPVLIDREHFNQDASDAWFAGVYNVTALPTVIRGASTKLDTYFLALHQTPDTRAGAVTNGGIDADTYTAGARLHTTPKPWDFDVEGNWQFGEFNNENLGAWMFATELGYTLHDVIWTPRLAAGLDVGSGSSDGSGRFNQLFPPTYMYLGHLYLFGRSNLIDAHGMVDFHLTPDLTLNVAYHAFWRQNTDDGLYNLSGATVRADNGTDAAYVGNEIDVAIYWQIQRHVYAYVGYAHFFAGDYLSDTGASKDADFLYASVTLTF